MKLLSFCGNTQTLVVNHRMSSYIDSHYQLGFATVFQKWSNNILVIILSSVLAESFYRWSQLQRLLTWWVLSSYCTWQQLWHQPEMHPLVVFTDYHLNSFWLTWDDFSAAFLCTIWFVISVSFFHLCKCFRRPMIVAVKQAVTKLSVWSSPISCTFCYNPESFFPKLLHRWPSNLQSCVWLISAAWNMTAIFSELIFSITSIPPSCILISIASLWHFASYLIR